MAAESVPTFAAESILNKVLSLAAQQFSLAWGFKAELRKLQESFADIERFLKDVADHPQQDRPESIEAWVKKLKDLAHDAEDVFDEFEWEVARRKVEIQSHMKKKVLNFFSLSNSLAFRLQMAHKIQKINASLVDLKTEASSTLKLIPMNRDATPQWIRWDRRTDSLIGGDEIIGRREDVSKIVTTLTDSKYNQENLAVMAIVGMAGLGKTTLAKSVYNEYSLHKFFEKRTWVSVSNTFDVTLILHRMLEYLTLTKAPSKDNQDAILKKLQEELKDKRYLLVLDDVWNEDAGKWEYLMECLSKINSAGGSKIIITTRSGKVASISEMILPRHEVRKLTVDECWSIMKSRVLPNSSAHIAPVIQEFETIGRQIAETCGGVPLVAKVVGGILRTKNIEEWSLFKDSRIWNNLLKGEDTIMPILKLSFDNLESPSLKQCFAYCSMLEKGFEIQRDNLIQLWMAQGLLHSSPIESRDMEDIGDEYFEILLQSSLFQGATEDYNGIITTCKMHNLIHDLSKLVSKSEISTEDLFEIRHVARVSTSILENIPQRSAGKLRSLFSDDGEVPTNILLRFKSLRVLNLSKANIKELPDSIETLKYLRYLDISKTIFKALPTSIGKLYNLQTLRATNCSLEEFPKELQNLINLRHIYFDECTKFPQGIRQWTCLRTLPYFPVGNEIGSGIEELAGLEQLKGKLVVCNLEHIKNGEEAKKAMLENKTKVCNVVFIWTKDRLTIDKNKEEDVLEGLRLHRELESLSIENFMGVKFPSWMCGSLLLNNLKIQLLDCEKCEGVPPLGHLPNLIELKISGMSNLKCLGAEFYAYDVVHSVCAPSEDITLLFPSLKALYISGCSELIEWKEEPMMSTKTVKVFPCLEKLDIRNCSKMRTAPNHFPALQKLVIISSESITPIEFLQKMVIPSSDSRMPVQEICRELKTLTSLEIEGIKKLTCLPQEILKKNQNLSSLELRECDDLTCIGQDVYDSCGFLERLVIWNCKNVCHLPEGLDTLPLLKYMDIYRCPSLGLIPITQGMTSLRKLGIKDCEELDSLGSSLLFPLSLETLAINGIPNLEILPGFDSHESLRELEIKNLRKLKYLPTGLQCLTGLEELRIGGFWEELAAFPDFQVGSSKHLTRLELTGWPKLKFLPEQIQHLSSLTHLLVYDFEGVETLPEWLGSLTSLTFLRFSHCKNLIKLPSVQAMKRLTKLKTLDIEGCSDHLKQSCTRDRGTEWHKISHIQRIRM